MNARSNSRRANGHRRDILRRRVLAAYDVCAICGRPVDKTLRSPHPMSAEVDELIPVSRGGDPLSFTRSLRQASMGRLSSMLAYKTKLAEGVGMIFVNPAYTSQTCSRCGHVDKKNRESQAVFVCKKCSYTANADVNAARNILERGLDTLAVTSENLWGADGAPVEQGHKTNGNAARESVALS